MLYTYAAHPTKKRHMLCVLNVSLVACFWLTDLQIHKFGRYLCVQHLVLKVLDFNIMLLYLFSLV